MLGVAACLALVGALVLPATAQAEVLVTNLGETSTIGGARLGPFDTAQGFSTGANAAGYVLTSIEVKIHTPPPTGKRVTAEVWTSSGGVPSARHATLIRPASIVAGNNTFWAHAGTTLAGDTTSYFVVLKSNDDTDTVKLSTTSSDDQGPDMTDWRIADNQRVKLDSSTDWTALDASSQSAQIRINGFTTESAPPQVTGAEVSTDGRSIALTFSEDLAGAKPGAGAFAVTVDGAANGVVLVGGTDDRVALQMQHVIGAGQAVVVSYDESDAGSQALADSDDQEVGDFTTGSGGVPAVDNKSTVDQTPPALTAATVAATGSTVTLTFGEDVVAAVGPLPSALADAFTVTVDGVDRGVTGVAALARTQVTLAVGSAIHQGQTVTVSYDFSAAGANALLDDANNDVASFTTSENSVPAVTNNSTVASAKLEAATVVPSGGRLSLAFDKNLNGLTGNATTGMRDWFTVTADGVEQSILSFQGVGSISESFLINFSTPIYKDAAVVVTYEKPAGSDGFTDNDNNLSVASFTTGEFGVPAVENHSTVASAKLTGASASLSGARVRLSFDKSLEYASDTLPSGLHGAFTVMADGTSHAIESITTTSAGPDKVDINLSSPIYKDAAVVVSYDRSAAGTDALVDDESDLSVASFTTGEYGVPAVTNNSGVYAPPTLTSAEVQARGDEIYLGFSEGLEVPATVAQALKDAFTVTVDGVERDFDDLEFFGQDAWIKLIYSSSTTALIPAGTAVVVSYDASAAGTSALEGKNSNQVADFTTGAGGVVAVTNNSTLSSDATLSGLTVSVRTGVGSALAAVALSPAFDSAIEAYSVSVAANRSVVSFMPTPSQTGATVAYFDADDMALADAGTTASPVDQGHQVDTAVGENTVKVKVTAPDRTTEKTYTVTVTRELPTLHGAGVQANGTSFALEFQANFPSGTGSLSAAAVAAFTVTADGVEREITGIVQEISDNILNITLSTAIYKDQAVVVSYDSAAAGADAIEDSEGNAFQSFTSGEDGVDAAVNNSTQTFPTPSTPTNFSATEGDKRVILAWDPPAATDPITRHDYRYKTAGDYPDTWTEIPDSGPGGTNQAGYTVTGLSNGTAYTFQLRAANRQNQGTAAESTAVTPMAVSTPTPANFAAAPGNARVTLSWDPPAADSGVTRHEYGQQEGTGAYGEWMRIANSGVGEANQAGFTVTGLTNETAYTFQLRAVNADGESTAAEAGPVTPTPGICDRTQGMQDAILAAVSGVTDCEAVTVANLLGVSTLNGSTRNIAALKSDDFAGMPNLVLLYLAQNSLNTLPADMFSGLTNLLLIPE